MIPVKRIGSKLQQHFSNSRKVIKHYLFLFFFLLILVWLSCCCYDSYPVIPKHLRRFKRYPEGYVIPEYELNDAEIEELKTKIEELNISPEVLNSDVYGAVADDTTTLVVQVRKDVERLQHLIISLAQVDRIRQALLVFSHSYYDEEMNELIRSIRFCRVMQIFYPYSLQLHPDKFPGPDPADGFDRDARRAEHKQHWWWKAHYIFNNSHITSKRLFIFLEEDDYVLPDFLYITQYVRRMLTYFPSAQVMALGGPNLENLEYDALLLDTWSPLYDRGLAFNVTTWRRITRTGYFCKYNDCSWSYSLLHVFDRSFPEGLVDVATCVAPRVVSSGGGESALAQARRAHEPARRAQLFPAALRAVVLMRAGGRVRPDPPHHAPGGWRDRRDQDLCRNIRHPVNNNSTYTNAIITTPAQFVPNEMISSTTK